MVASPKIEDTAQDDMMRTRLLMAAFSRYRSDEVPFLKETALWALEKHPYRDLKILNNMPLTMETVMKIIPLVVGGGRLTVTSIKILEPEPEAVDFLSRLGIEVEPNHDALRNDYDIVLDCCAEMLDRLNPRLGAVELTQTGSVRYHAASERLNYPVISVDDSPLKVLETLYGTGDGFIRALVKLTHADVCFKRFMIFGFGKVGRGVLQALRGYTNDVIVVDRDRAAVQDARSEGFTAFLIPDEIALVRQALRRTFCTVTATGQRNAISEMFSSEDFSNVLYLANMGADDEYGEKFSVDQVLYNKRPLNFAIPGPTKMRFLDPIFFAHNDGIRLLLEGAYRPGYHPYPERESRDVLTRFGQKSSDLVDDQSVNSLRA